MSLSCGWLQPHYRDGTPIPMHDYNNDIHQLYSAGCDGHCCWHCGKDSFWAEKLNKVSTIICIPPTSNPVIRISRQRLLFTDGLINHIVKILVYTALWTSGISEEVYDMGTYLTSPCAVYSLYHDNYSTRLLVA